MCGILAILSRSRKPITRRWSKDHISKALDTMAHRGPDGRGQWWSEDHLAYLGHRRLSIVGGSSGTQPLFNEDRTVVAVVNGEIYKALAWQQSLRHGGHVLRSQSDSEILLHLYEDRDLDALRFLNGALAFVLLDLRQGMRWVAGRDRFGIRPLYLYRDEDFDILSSEYKPFRALGLGLTPSWEALAQCIGHQYLSPIHTPFQEVRSLRPGWVYTFERGRQLFRGRAYWQLPLAGSLKLEEGDFDREANRVFSLLQEAVQIRMQGQGRKAVALSGGLDSSIIAALTFKEDPNALAVTFKISSNDEEDYRHAEYMAKFLGIKLKTLAVTPRALLENLDAAVEIAEGLSINSHLSAKYMLNEWIRAQGAKIVLLGEGADEAFWGYIHLKQDLFNGLNRDSLDWSKEDYLEGVMLATGIEELSAWHRRSWAKGIEVLGMLPSFFQAKMTLGSRLYQLLDPKVREGLMQSMALPMESLLKALPKQEWQQRQGLDRSSWLWIQLALSHYILRILNDGTEVAHGIEGRLPFLDHHLFEYVQRLPSSWKLDKIEKKILRHAVKGRSLIPEVIRTRPKKPFVLRPVIFDESKEVYQWMKYRILERGFESQLFNGSAIWALYNEIRRDTLSRRRQWEAVFWALLTLDRLWTIWFIH